MMRLTNEFRIEEWLRQRYEVEQMSTRQIAQLCGVSHSAICYWMRKHGIARRPKDAHMRELNKSKRQAKTDKMFEKFISNYIEDEWLFDAFDADVESMALPAKGIKP